MPFIFHEKNMKAPIIKIHFDGTFHEREIKK